MNSLQPYSGNARVHSEEQLEKIKNSILEFGFQNPILIGEDSEVIAGHGRLEAAKKAGLGKVPVVVLSGLSEAQRKAYVIADNQLALTADWNDRILQERFEELESLGFDLNLLGWDDLPEFASTPDYSILDDEGLNDAVQELAEGVKKAILIEFDSECYEEAFELVKFWRERTGNVGLMVLDALRKEKGGRESGFGIVPDIQT